MIAVDTNVVVRFLVADDPVQNARARRLFTSTEIFVPVTVILETEWVLRGAYGLASGEIRALLRGVLGLPRVICEESDKVARALIWHERGLDFADALHLASIGDAQALATFDAKLRRRARGLGGPEVVAP